MKRHCTSEAVEYTLNLLDGMVSDVLDLVCRGHADLRGPKCAKLLKDSPLSASRTTIKKSEGLLLPLVDILTSMGAMPDSYAL